MFLSCVTVKLSTSIGSPSVANPITSRESINALISTASISSVDPNSNASSGALSGSPAYKVSITASLINL